MGAFAAFRLGDGFVGILGHGRRMLIFECGAIARADGLREQGPRAFALLEPVAPDDAQGRDRGAGRQRQGAHRKTVGEGQFA